MFKLHLICKTLGTNPFVGDELPSAYGNVENCGYANIHTHIYTHAYIHSHTHMHKYIHTHTKLE